MSNADRPVFNDRYEVHSRIGRGGMADVFLARDRLLDRPVAVKVLFPEFATDPSFVERFRREAQAAANLTHPNIVGVYDWGKQASTYYIVMEYVNGRTLADILRADGSLLPQRAADVAGDVASALGFAHKNGVVHRDVKPGNILVSNSGVVKVADFGIARALNSAVEQGLTQAGAVMGTATYFSPEQAQGANPDPRSDLYSLGIVMYEMVAGSPPFSGENPVSIAYKQVHDIPRPLSALKPDVPKGYEAVVMKLLKKSAAHRYATADDLRADLRRYRDGQPVEAMRADAGAATGVMTRATTAIPADAAVTQAVVPTQIARPPATRVQSAQVVPVAPMQVPRPVPPAPRGPAMGEREYGEPPNRVGWYIAAAIFAVALLAIGAVALFKSVGTKDAKPIDQVTVPTVRDMKLEEATKLLGSKNLVADVEPQLNDAVAVGLVWNQDPPSGSLLKAGDHVKVIYNPGKSKVTLEDFVAEQATSDVASAKLASLGLQVELASKESDTVPVGVVLDQNPKAGQIDAGSKVTLTVSAGKGKVDVPNVFGLDQVDATAQLVTKGLNPKVVQEASDKIEPGKVVRTDPVANTNVDKGSTVTMVVSSGPAPVDIPNVENQSEADATAAIQKAGLVARSISRDVPFGSQQDGKVLEQNPLPGQAPRGTVITITIARALPAPTTTTTQPPSTTTSSTTQPATTTTKPPGPSSSSSSSSTP